MELRNFIYIIRRSLIWIVITAVVTGAAGLILALQTPVSYDTSLAFAINRINKQATADYQYDGYYAIQASDLFAQTVTSWIATPSILLEMYERADVDPQIKSLSSFSSRFTTKKYSSQNIGIRFSERDQETAEKLSAAIIGVLSEKTSAINKTADAKALFEIVGSQPVIVKTQPAPILWAALGVIAGALAALLLVVLVYYLRMPVRPDADRG